MYLRPRPSTLPGHFRMAALTAAVVALIALLQVSAIGADDPVLTFVEIQKDGVGGVDGLEGAISVTVSPDGKHLYAASEREDAVAVFSRDSTTGALTFVEVHKDGVGGVDGLNNVNSVTVSPDGKHLYTAAHTDDAVAVFSRDSTTGALAFMEVHKDGVGGVDGLDGAFSVTVSPDGKHLYAASLTDDAVAVFSRDSTTGALTFVEVHKDGVGGVDGLDEGRWVTVSPDGKYLYAAGNDDDAVAVFNRDSTTGALTFVEVQRDGVGGVDGLDAINEVTVSPDGKHVYAAGSVDSAVAVFSVTRHADLAITKSVDDPSPEEGETVTFTVTVSNDGPDTATGVVVSDVIPSGLTFQSATPSDGAYSSGTGDWALASSLAPGARATLTLVTMLDAREVNSAITNTASVAASDAIDPDADNDSDSVTVAGPTPLPIPSVGIWGLAITVMALAAVVAWRTRRRAMRA